MRSPAQGCRTQSVPRQGHNTPLPLERSAPASFKRLLGSVPPRAAPLNLSGKAAGNATEGQGDLKDRVSATGKERGDVCKDEECHGDLQQDPSDGVRHDTGPGVRNAA